MATKPPTIFIGGRWHGFTHSFFHLFLGHQPLTIHSKYLHLQTLPVCIPTELQRTMVIHCWLDISHIINGRYLTYLIWDIYGIKTIYCWLDISHIIYPSPCQKRFAGSFTSSHLKSELFLQSAWDYPYYPIMIGWLVLQLANHCQYPSHFGRVSRLCPVNYLWWTNLLAKWKQTLSTIITQFIGYIYSWLSYQVGNSTYQSWIHHHCCWYSWWYNQYTFLIHKSSSILLATCPITPLWLYH